MKSWLSGIMRIFLDFSLAALLLTMVEGLSASLLYPSLALLPLLALRALPALLPLSLGLALILAAPGWRQGRVSPLAAWGGMLLSALVIIGGGIALSRLSLPDPALPAPSPPPAGRFIEAEGRALAARAWEGNRAVDLVLVDFGKESPPRLEWVASLEQTEGRIVRDGRSYALREGGGEKPRILAATGLSFEAAWLARLGSATEAGLPTALLAGLGFCLLLAGALLPAMRTPWPLAAFVVAGLGCCAAFALDLALDSSSLRGLLEPLAARLGFQRHILVAAAEGLAGMLLAGLSLLSRQRKNP
jgi:hypothetical protein